jgi:O-antigen/teichoic acid export membrane protein
MALNTLGGLVVGRLVAPATLGLFHGIGLVLGYVPVLELGILNGLNRELPYAMGKGDREQAKQLAAAGQAWALLVGGAVCVALWGVAGWELVRGEAWRAASWFTNGLLAVLLFYSQLYMETTYRTAHDFARLALVRVLQSLAALALLVLVGVLNFYGLCLRAVLTAAVGGLLLYWWRPFRVGPRWHCGHLKQLLRVGAPILAVGQIYMWWPVVDRTLVLGLAGTEAMGLYAVALMAVGAVGVLPAAMSQIMYPRLAQQFGVQESLAALLRLSWKPMLVTAALLIPLVIAGWFLAPPLVRWLIPAYVEATPAMQWALPSALVACFDPLQKVFNVIRRQGLRLVALLLGIAAYGASLLLLVEGGVYLAAFPQAMLVGRLVHTVLSLFLLWWLKRREHDGAQVP